jgi:4-hydroxy-tetrahydrodipicolinate synthase
MKQVMDIIARCGEDFVVLSGEDYMTFPLMSVGGKGVISVVSNIAPRDMAEMCRFALEGRWEEAREISYKLLPLCHILFCETNPVPVKAALAMMGKIPSDEVRLPLAPLSEVNRAKLYNVVREYGLVS